MASFMRPSASVLRLAAGPAARNAAFYSTRSSPLPIASSLVNKKPLALATRRDVAGFHATSRREILPPLPQTIEGTMNDPAPVPPTHPSEGSYHWTFERVIAASLIPLTIAPFAGGALNPVMDAVFCGALILHSHIGFQACIVDYIPNYRMPKVKKLFDWILRFATLGAAVGLYEFETNDIGVTAAVARIWQA
ncbi:membrane anchor subunit of succinate dehydrogenase, Sdh4 [Onygenales sp. PD_40]|nr:membrane anchor subunit of succinate dehydrogenase, Sdh4 [Onygenales sp. PD_40]KAK2784943.1 membrane anchor subunit of succinate dehydrogenase, Sdh4 [Emmonsiellopsis sp. PD_33]